MSSEAHLGVRLEFSELSRASWPIDPRIDGPAFGEFFAQLARRREDALDDLIVHSLDSDLTLSASQSRHGDRGQVDLIVRLSCDTQDPYWTAELVNLEKGRLDKLAGDAGQFFGSFGAG